MISKIETKLAHETATAMLCLLVEQYGMDGRLRVNFSAGDKMTEHMELDYEISEEDDATFITLKKWKLS